MENHSNVLIAKLVTLVPPLEDLAKVIQKNMKRDFSEVSVEVTSECPDLTETPYSMTASSFGGSLRIADVGGNGHLYPVPRPDIYYKLKEICQTCELSNGFVFGPAAGPRHVIGSNSETVVDANFSENPEKVAIKAGIVCDKSEDRYKMTVTDKPEFCILGNLAISEPGIQTQLLKVRAFMRTGDVGFTESLREAIASHYKDELISCAGVFTVKNSKVKIHVMPEFTGSDFSSPTQMANWLEYLELSPTVVCTTVINTKDIDNCKLRLEHTHCYTDKMDKAGHFYGDIEPDLVEYVGYFAIAQALYRIDRA